MMLPSWIGLLGALALAFNGLTGALVYAELDGDDGAQTEAELWTPVTLKIPVSERWSVATMVLPLWRDSEPGLSRLQTRGGVYYRPIKSLEMGVTMDYIPTFQPEPTTEWRMGQQWVWSQPMGPHWQWTNRVRTEQRWAENMPTRHRLRVRNRLTRALPKQLYTFAEQELLMNVGRHQTGFDQHRLFVGLGRHWGGQQPRDAKFSLETGYQWIYANTSNPANTLHAHVWMVQGVLQTPRIFSSANSKKTPLAVGGDSDIESSNP
ncbi:MAG: DUF2490 domain-containing protein [Vampirovibrionales bacterium]